MRGLDILNDAVVTIIPNASGMKDGVYIKREVPLRVVIDDLPNMVQSKLIAVKNMEYHSDEQKKAKLSLPRYYIAGKFEPKYEDGVEVFNIKDSTLTTRTNLMCVDIDKKGNESLDFDEVRKTIFNLPYVLGVYESVSGKGIYAIVSIQYAEYTVDYYEYLAEMLLKIYHIKVDGQAKNIARARIISYDENWKQWTHFDEVQTFTLRKIKVESSEMQKIFHHPKVKKTYTNNDDYMKERTHQAIKRILDDGYKVESGEKAYGAWYHLACEFKNFDDGLELFTTLSNNGGWKDDDTTIENKYDKAVAVDINEVNRKWQGMAKNRYGLNWWK